MFVYSAKFLVNTLFKKELFLVIKDYSTAKKIEMNEWSGLAFIDIKDKTTPFELATEWLDEARNYGIYMPTFNLATSTKSGEVSNRFLVLRDFKDETFRFVSNENSLKGLEMRENPKVAACFLLKYLKEGKRITRQLRCQGTVSKMSYEKTSEYYKKEPLFCQIRSQICRQGEIVVWDDQKRKYDELLEKIQQGVALTMPEYQTGYEIRPFSFDFYDSADNQIADRIVFKKSEENGCWDFNRVAA